MISLKKVEKIYLILSLIFISGGLFVFTIPERVSNSDMIENAEEGNIVSQIIYLIIYSIGLVLLYSKKRGFGFVTKSQRLLIVLFVFCLLSTIWSVNSSTTFRRVFALIGPSAIGCYIALRYSYIESLKLINYSFILMSLLSIFTVFFLPQYGLMTESLSGEYYVGAWKGIFLHKNVLGRNMAILMIISFVLFTYDKKIKHLLFAFLSGYIIIESHSITSLIIALLSVFLIFFFDIIQNRKKHYVLITFSVILFLSSVIYIITSPTDLFLLLERDSTLTGRTVIWSKSVDAIFEKPFFGYGYGAFWLKSTTPASKIWHSISWTSPNAHNGFLDIILQIGIIGLLIVLLIIVPLYISYIRKSFFHKTKIYHWGISFFTIVFIYNMVETNILSHNDIYWLLIIYTITTYTLIKKSINVTYKKLPL